MEEGTYLRLLVNYVTPTRASEVVKSCDLPLHNLQDDQHPCVIQIEKSDNDFTVVYCKDRVSGKYSVKLFPTSGQSGATMTRVKAYFKCRNNCGSGTDTRKQDRGWALISSFERQGKIMEKVFIDVKVVERPAMEMKRCEQVKAAGRGRGRKRKVDGVPST